MSAIQENGPWNGHTFGEIESYVKGQLNSKAKKPTSPSSGNVPSIDENGDLKDSGIPASNIAQKDGDYPELSAGLADNLATDEASVNTTMEDGDDVHGEEYSDNFVLRSTAGNLSVKSGVAEIRNLKGNTIVWNQLITNYASSLHTGWASQNATISVVDGVISLTPNDVNNAHRVFLSRSNTSWINGHKYLAIADAMKDGNLGSWTLTFTFATSGHSSLGTRVSIGSTTAANEWQKIGCIYTMTDEADYLGCRVSNSATAVTTAKFKNLMLFDLTQMGIADSISTVADFDTWLRKHTGRLAPFAYDAGSLKSFNPKTLWANGFNQWDGEKALVLGGNEYYISGAFTAVQFSETIGGVRSDVTVTERKFTPSRVGYVFVVGADDTTCINLCWSGDRNGEYEPYEEHEAKIDVSSIVDGNGVSVFPHGLLRVNNVFDEIVNEKAVKRCGIVDLGTLTWTKSGSDIFYARVTDRANHATNLLCDRYPTASTYNNNDKVVTGINAFTSGNVIIRDSSLASLTAAQFKTAMNGVMLVYTLATPQTYDLPSTWRSQYICNDYGLEEFRNPSEALMIAPYGAQFAYARNLKDELRNHIDRHDEEWVRRDDVAPRLVSGLAMNLVDTKGNGTAQEFLRRTSCGRESIADDGTGIVKKVKGKTIVWNQLVQNGNFESASGWEAISATFSVSGGVATVTPSVSNGGIRRTMSLKSGHTYYISFDVNTESGAGTSYIYSQSSNMGAVVYSNGINHISRLLIPSIDVTYVWLRFPKASVEYNVSNVQICDLTAMFGSGNEPNADGFKALYVKPYYAYNAGQLLSLNASGIVTDGFNQYNGQYARVFGGKEYYISGTYTAVKFAAAVDGAQTDVTVVDRLFTPSEDGYVFVTGADSTTCINLSWSGYRNGEYEDYWQNDMKLNLTTLTGSVNGQGASIVIFPDGMRGVGTVYDELISEGGMFTKAVKRFAIVDLGSLTWTKTTADSHARFVSNAIDDIYGSSNKGNTLSLIYHDSTKPLAPSFEDKALGVYQDKLYIFNADYENATDAEFKAAMSGTFLIYQVKKASQVEYLLDNPFRASYPVSDFGTGTILPEGVDESGVPMTAPFTADIKYSDDFTRRLVNMPKNYISKATFDDFVAKFAAATGMGITYVWEEATGKYVFTIDNGV